MQSQARALGPLDALPLDAEELVEKKRPVLFRDTDAGVGDGDRHLSAGEAAGNRDLAAGLVVLDGIGDQVVEQNIQAVPVARYAQRFFRPNGFERNLLGSGHLLVTRQDARYDGFEVNLDPLVDERAALHSGEREPVGNQLLQLLGPLEAAVDPFLSPGRVVFGLVEVFEHVQVLVDGHQRRAQLMRHEGDKAPLEERAIHFSPLRLERQPPPVEPAVDNHPQLIRRKRLGQEIVRAGFHGLHGGVDGGVTRDDHHDDLGVDFMDPGDDLQAADARHFEIHHTTPGLSSATPSRPRAPLSKATTRKPILDRILLQESRIA